MKALTLLSGLVLSVLIVSCASGKKQLEHGNYHQALNLALTRLQDNPNHQKARETLIKAYPLAMRFYRGQIARKLASENALKWEWVIADYRDLNFIYEALQRSPLAQDLFPNAPNYYREIEHAQALAAAERYRLGMEALGLGSKQEARMAFDHFRICNEIAPGFRDVVFKMHEARQRGTIRVLVDLVPVSSRFYQVSAEYFSDAIREFLYGYQESRFVDFMFAGDPNTRDQHWDHILKLRFEDFEVGHTHVFHERKKVSRDSVVVGVVTLDDGSRKNVYSTVKAEVDIFRKEIQSQGLLSMQLIEGRSGILIHRDEFPGSYQWVAEWGHFHGDERALDHKLKTLCSRHEQLPPPPQAMFVEFTKPIQSNVAKRIDYLYRQYSI